MLFSYFNYFCESDLCRFGLLLYRKGAMYTSRNNSNCKYNVSSHFTQSYNQSGMFEDTSIQTATKDKILEKTGRKNANLTLKRVKGPDLFTERVRKMQLIEKLRLKYPLVKVKQGLVHIPDSLIHEHFTISVRNLF